MVVVLKHSATIPAHGFFMLIGDTPAASRRLLLVAAAALLDSSGRVLITQRPQHKALGGLWEFPGGKVEPGEAPEAALIRELKEELDLSVASEDLEPFAFASHAYPEFHLLMPLYVCRRWTGTPESREGQALKWVRAKALRDYPMPPADEPLIPFLMDLL
jgi:8-oxo-dGTP diphosphatase